jgi:hypothetical protein
MPFITYIVKPGWIFLEFSFLNIRSLFSPKCCKYFYLADFIGFYTYTFRVLNRKNWTNVCSRGIGIGIR